MAMLYTDSSISGILMVTMFIMVLGMMVMLDGPMNSNNNYPSHTTLMMVVSSWKIMIL